MADKMWSTMMKANVARLSVAEAQAIVSAVEQSIALHRSAMDAGGLAQIPELAPLMEGRNTATTRRSTMCELAMHIKYYARRQELARDKARAEARRAERAAKFKGDEWTND
jgi:hypothetical protein